MTWTAHQSVAPSRFSVKASPLRFFQPLIGTNATLIPWPHQREVRSSAV